jgi:uncharacterized delta-60 repeat protein
MLNWMILILIIGGETKMKRNSRNPRRSYIISTMLICIVCILLLSFFLGATTLYDFTRDNVDIPTRSLQTSSNNPPVKEWNATWGGSNDDRGEGITLDSSENIYISGRTESFGPGMTNIALVKYNNLGEKQWNTTWGGSGFSFQETGMGIVLDSLDNIYVCGFTATFGAGSIDIVLIKYNSFGEQQWNTTWGGGGSESGWGIALGSLDNIYICGFTTSFGKVFGDMVLVKFNSSGDLQWNTTWGGTDYEFGREITLDSSENIYISGSTESFGSGEADIALVKFNSSGDLQWNTTWGGSDYESGTDIALDSSENIYLSGYTKSFGAGGKDIVLLKFNSSGDLQWNTTWGGSGDDSGDSIVIDPINDIYLGGNTESFGAGGFDVVLVKFNSSGDLQWNSTWGGSGNEYAIEIEISLSNNIYITGKTNSYGVGGEDLVLIKYTGISYSNPTGPILGYDLFLLLGAICIISAIIIERWYLSKKQI